jgi:hypothetical protein
MNDMKNISNTFTKIFEICLKDIIIPYFITNNQYSDHSHDLCNLLNCSHIIKKIFKQKFNLRRMYYINDIIDLSQLEFVKNITFGDIFDQPLEKDTLPKSLTSLTFGINFDQPLKEEYFPSNLTQLTFGEEFNQPIKERYLPSNLTQLTFGTCFNQPIKEGDIPSNLTKLKIHRRYANILLSRNLDICFF